MLREEPVHGKFWEHDEVGSLASGVGNGCNGVFEIVVTITDDLGNSDSDTINVTSIPPDYITLGSHKDDVMRIEGTPAYIVPYKFDETFIGWHYGGNVGYFIFGPEGGLTDDELMLFENKSTFRLSNQRLRSETAIIKVASLL